MLYRLIAPMGCGKKERLLEEAQKAFLQGKKVYFIVPEQASADYELALLRRLGPKSQGMVEVVNFSRLPNVVQRSHGLLAARKVTEEEKKLLLFSCLDAASPALKHLSDRCDPDALNALYGELEELRLAGLDCASLAQLSKDAVLEGELGEKLQELLLILRAFEVQTEAVFGQAEDEMARLARILEEVPFFRNSTVFIDGFWDFTAPQEKILRRILGQAESVWISFVCKRKKDEVLAKGYDAARRLLTIARQCGVEVRDEVLPVPEEEGDLAFFRDHLLVGAAPRLHTPETITLTACASPSEEAEWVASTIRDLAAKNVRWNEIAVLSRNGEGDRLLALTLESRQIPFFLEEKKPVEEDPLAETLLLAAKIALGEGGEEDVRRYLSVGQFLYRDENRYLLEKYVSTWSLSGKRCLQLKPFFQNPDGYFELNEESREELSRVNLAKEEIFSPLRQLSLALAVGTNEKKVAALIAFLNRIGAEKVMSEGVEQAKERGDFALAGERVRAWNCVLEKLSHLALALGEKESEGMKFYSLLRLTLSGDLPGSVPTGQDRVFIGSVAFARPTDAKYVLLTGMNAGVFPAEEKKGGFLSPAQRETLSEWGYPLSAGEVNQNNECFYFYLALSWAKCGLFLSYRNAAGDGIGKSGAGLFVKRALTLFPNLSHKVFRREERIPDTKEELFRYWLRHLGEENEGLAFLEKTFSQNEIDAKRMLDGAAAKAFSHRERRVAEKALLGNRDVNLTYSRMEKYVYCPYSYFAQYHLKAKNTGKARFGNNVVGSFVHGVLEAVFLKIQEDDFHLRDLDDKVLERYNRDACREYLQNVLPGLEGGRVEYLVRQITRSTLLILKHLKKEFSRSAFQPIFFEMDLSCLDGDYQIPLPDGRTIILRGKIDRVDLYEKEDGTSFVRVVDYKSGEHDFNLEDVANGLDLQMLLYLFALWEKGFTRNGKKILPQPAGVIYLNGMDNASPCEGPEEVKKVQEEPHRALNRKGLVVEDADLYRAQDPDGMGEFIPVAWANSRSRSEKGIVSMANLGRLKKKVERDLVLLVTELDRGNVSALPLCKKGKDGPCGWCEFKPICKRDPDVKKPFLKNPTEEEIFGKEDETNG